MNVLQLASAARHLLTTVGSVGTTVALFSPQWGFTIQAGVAAAGTIITGLSWFAGIFSPVKTAAIGLSSAEAAAVLNKASLAKAGGQSL